VTVEFADITARLLFDVFLAKCSLIAIKEIDMNKLHQMIGHCGVDRLKKTTNIHGVKWLR
jgi:hypothetical protein